MPDPTLQASVDSVERMRLELGATPIELIAERVQDARTELLEAMKRADRFEEGDLHRAIAALINVIDGLMAICAERSAT